MGGGESRRESKDPCSALGPLRFPACKQRFHKCTQRPGLSVDAARRIRAQEGYRTRLRAGLTRYRLGRDHFRAARGEPDVQMGEKVLEIGTGSGNQSAYLSNLTDKVWTI